jgi:nitroimidazol reductase NimA-like FMN-containing flavoprotein (pyridoxamine 5'-phosphate oxidase superfamily)
MASWREVEEAEPEFAQAVRERLDAGKHKTLATLRRDGSPRISGTEATFFDGDLWFGSMWRSRKALDLRRDPRMALHSASEDPPEWSGDAKVAGRVEEVDDEERRRDLVRAQGHEGEGPSGQYHLFRIDISEVVLTRLGDPADHLSIELWREGEGLKRMRR